MNDRKSWKSNRFGRLFFTKFYYRDDYEIRDWVGWTIAFAILVSLVVGFDVGIRTLNAHYTERNCVRFGAETGREVRFIEVSYFDYDCYVRTGDGWVVRGSQMEVQNP